MFKQITDPLRPFSFFFFLSIISVAIFVFDHANHTLKKMKSSRVQWVSFYAQIAYCLKTEALVVAQSYRSRDANPNVLKGMNTEAWRFRINKVRCVIFGCSNPSLVRKV